MVLVAHVQMKHEVWHLASSPRSSALLLSLSRLVVGLLAFPALCLCSCIRPILVFIVLTSGSGNSKKKLLLPTLDASAAALGFLK